MRKFTKRGRQRLISDRHINLCRTRDGGEALIDFPNEEFVHVDLYRAAKVSRK